MSDKALNNAKRLRDELLGRKKELQEQIADVDSRLDRIEMFIADWDAYATGDAAKILLPVNVGDRNRRAPSRHTAKRATGNSRKEAVAEGAREIIRERGEPVPRSELYKALVERGFKIDGRDPEMILSTMLWRMKHRVVRLQSGGYWLADEANEAAGYHPEETSNG